jgi:hypothetical protein
MQYRLKLDHTVEVFVVRMGEYPGDCTAFTVEHCPGELPLKVFENLFEPIPEPKPPVAVDIWFRGQRVLLESSGNDTLDRKHANSFRDWAIGEREARLNGDLHPFISPPTSKKG